MKATSRRRLLVSSVAMLLVAMLALGTATYAWFSQNTKATASGITAKTSQASNIVVSETGNEGTWSDSIVFATYAKGTYNPVTPGADISNPTWVTTTASALNAGVKGADKSYDPATANTDFTSTKLYVKYDAAASESQAVKITANVTTTTGDEKFLRIALVPVDSATKGIVATPVVYGEASDDFAKAPDSMSLTTPATPAQTITTTNSKTMVTSATLTGGTEYQFAVYVWYEGTDPHCIDSNANNDLTVNFEVSKA